MDQFLSFIASQWLLSSIFGVLLLLFLANELKSHSAAALGPDQVTQAINHHNAVVVDLREAEVYQEGHIVDAINLNTESLIKSPKALNKYKNRLVILVDATGNAVKAPMLKLKTEGFAQVACLAGGISAWQNANLPLVKGN